MKKTISMMLSLLLVLTFALPVLAAGNPVSSKKADMSGYTNLKDPDHVYVTATPEQVKDAMDQNKTFAFFVGRDTCKACQQAVPLLNDVAKKQGQKVVYLDATKQPVEEVLYPVLTDYLTTSSTGKKMLAQPTVFFVKDGKVVYHFTGCTGTDLGDRLVLSQDDKDTMSSIYRTGFHKMLTA